MESRFSLLCGLPDSWAFVMTGITSTLEGFCDALFRSCRPRCFNQVFGKASRVASVGAVSMQAIVQ